MPDHSSANRTAPPVSEPGLQDERAPVQFVPGLTAAWLMYRRDLGLAVSLGSLAMIKVWARLLFSNRIDLPQYTRVDFAALGLNVLGLAAVFFVLRVIGRSPNGILGLCRYIPLLAFLMALDFVRRQLKLSVSETLAFWGAGGTLLLMLLGVVGAFSAALRWRRTLGSGLETLALCLLVLPVMLFTQAAWKALSLPPVTPSPGTTELLPVPDGQPRLLWLHFDEFDQRLAFDERPASLSLPELDRLRGEALSATNVLAFSDNTASSTTVLLTGKPVAQSILSVPRELPVVFQGAREPVQLSSQPNVFREAHKLGYNVAIAGWFLPYCNMFSESVSRCFWAPSEIPPTRSGILETMLLQLRSLTFVSFRLNHVDAYRSILRETRSMVTDKRFGFVYVHWPIPHGPFVYDRRTHRFDILRFSPEGYLDNLALVDSTIGELRTEMEKAGVWGPTTVLVTSDHWWRRSAGLDHKHDFRVPLLLKLAGQRQGRVYAGPLDHFTVHELVKALLRGEVSDPTVTHWLDEHRSAHPRQASGTQPAD